MKTLFSALLYFLSLQLTVSGQSQLIDKVKFFTDETILPVTIVTSINKILNSSGSKKGTTYPARFTLMLPDSSTISQKIKIEIRGHLRREYCHLPPLKIIFNKNDSSSSPLSTLKNLKLVNGCMPNNAFNQYVLMEFLTYKIFNLLTEKSFRVRLLKLTYMDSSGKKKPATNYGFFIENEKELARRNACKEYTTGRIKSEKTERKQMTLVALFEYMIGNTDWSVTVRHNIKTIIPKKDSAAKPFAVPYDFDYSGLVNTNYAIPDPELNTKSVTERVYRGYPRTMEELNEALVIFNRQKDSIFSLVNHFELLSKRNREYMINYLDEFYDIIKDPRDVKYTFINGARID